MIHDPTSLDKQGADEGPQYASKLFYTNDEQKAAFEAGVRRAQTYYDKPIVTIIEKLDAFYEAEPEHQDYFDNNPQNPYCPVVISPKIAKARKEYSAWFKQDA